MPAILADTSAIIEFFRPGGSDDMRQEVAGLLDTGQLALCGIVAAELIQGVRPEERQPLMDLLEEVPIWDLTKEDYFQAGDLSNTLRRKGLKIPITDMVIAALAMRMKTSVLTLDKKDFGAIPGLKLA